MRVIIVAAGSSTRLGHITKNIPKGLLEVNGKSIIGRQVELYKNNGLTDIVIITGPHKEKFDFNNVAYIADENHEKHDVLGSMMVAKNYMNTDVLISYSDILFDDSILKQMLEFNDDIGIGVDMNWLQVYKNRTQHPITDADNVLINNGVVVKTRKNISECDKNILGEFIGLIRLSANGAKMFVKLHKKLEKNHKGKFHESVSYEKAVPTDMFQELINSGIIVKPIIVSGKWREIDTPQDLER